MTAKSSRPAVAAALLARRVAKVMYITYVGGVLSGIVAIYYHACW